MSNAMVTGASGFVGRKLCQMLAEKGCFVRAVIRHDGRNSFQGVRDVVAVDDIGPQTDWASSLQGIDVIIHLAARVHVMKESLKDPLAEYRRVNVEGTKHLARMAARAGVQRLVYVSTIKVNGESTGMVPFRENDAPSPQDPYSISKWEAEEVLREISTDTGIDVVIIRPPLVYGPGVKGNMISLMRYINKGYPLPFGNIHNSRSFISLDNLVDVLILSATRPECAGNTFLVSDGHDISTTELIRRISQAMGGNTKLINFPYKTCSLISRIIPSLQPVIERLTGSLVIDNTKFRNMLHWNPPQTLIEGIKSMVSDYLRNKSCNIDNEVIEH